METMFLRKNSRIFAVASSLQLVISKNKNMLSKKKINVPTCNFSLEEIYALLDSTERNHEKDIDNLMNDSDTEFVDYPLLEGRVSHKDIQ